MTEKRFIVQERCVVDTTDNETFEFSFKVDAEIICEKLNNVVDENEELKKEVKQLKNKIKTYNSTHELLKETIDRLRSDG